MTDPSRLRAANAAINAQEFAERRLVLDSMPTMLYVELTQNCNLSCAMCRSASQYDPARDMHTTLFDTVVRELMPFATMVDLRGWGESTIMRSFPSALKAPADTGVRLRLVTNALAMAPHLWEALFSADAVVAVSFDAVSPALSTTLGRGNVTRVIDNVRTGVRIRQSLGRGSVYFNTIVSALNVCELERIIEVAHDLDVGKVVLNPVKTAEASALHLSRASDALLPALRACAARACDLGVEVVLGAALQEDTILDFALPSACSNPWSHVVIAYDGDIIFCDHLIGQPSYAVGNIGRQDFREIWNGARMAGVRAAHVRAEATREVGCLRKCTWCYSNRYADSESAPALDEPRRRVTLTASLRPRPS